MKKSTRLIITAAAIAGLYAGSFAVSAHAQEAGAPAAPADAKAKEACKAKESCKGKASCENCECGDKASCKAKESCKGKDGCGAK